MPAAPIIQLDDITFTRGDTRILSNVSWQIQPGEHWALLGANGSGKTTLLKVITGYEWPSEGTVRVLGRRFGECSLPELRRSLGWVSAAIERRLPARDTAIEVVASGFDATIGLYRAPDGEEWDRAAEALAQTGADHLAGRRFGLLSQGEQQRILIARAMVHRPALLILDEPCVGLDPVARERLLVDLDRLSRSPESPTLLLVTHHIEEIGPWIDRILALKTGRVLASGLPEDVLKPAVLEQAFGESCAVERRAERWFLHVTPVCSRRSRSG